MRAHTPADRYTTTKTMLPPSGVLWVVLLGVTMASVSAILLFDFELRDEHDEFLLVLLNRDSKIVRNVMHSAFIVVFMSSFWRGNSVLGYFFPLLGAFFASMIGLQTSVLGGLQMYFFGMAYADIFAYSVVWCLIFGAGYVGIYRYGKTKRMGDRLAMFPTFRSRNKFEMLPMSPDLQDGDHEDGDKAVHRRSDLDMDVHKGVASHSAGTGVYYETSSTSTAAFFADAEDNSMAAAGTGDVNQHTELMITKSGLSRLESDDDDDDVSSKLPPASRRLQRQRSSHAEEAARLEIDIDSASLSSSSGGGKGRGRRRRSGKERRKSRAKKIPPYVTSSSVEITSSSDSDSDSDCVVAPPSRRRVSHSPARGPEVELLNQAAPNAAANPTDYIAAASATSLAVPRPTSGGGVSESSTSSASSEVSFSSASLKATPTDGGGQLPKANSFEDDFSFKAFDDLSDEMRTEVNRLRFALILEIVFVVLYTSGITAVRTSRAISGPPVPLLDFIPEFCSSFTVAAGHRAFILATGFTAASRCIKTTFELFLIGNCPFALLFAVQFFVALFSGQSPYSVAVLLLQVWVMSLSIFFTLRLRVLCLKRDEQQSRGGRMETASYSEATSTGFASSVSSLQPSSSEVRPTLFTMWRDPRQPKETRRWAFWTGFFSIMIFMNWNAICALMSVLGAKPYDGVGERFYHLETLGAFAENVNNGAHSASLFVFLFYICVQNRSAFQRLRVMNVVMGIVVASVALFQAVRLYQNPNPKRDVYFYIVFGLLLVRAVANYGISLSFYKLRLSDPQVTHHKGSITSQDFELSHTTDDTTDTNTGNGHALRAQANLMAYNKWKTRAYRATVLYCMNIAVVVFCTTIHEARMKDLSLISADEGRPMSDIGTHTIGYALVYHFCYLLPVFVLHSINYSFVISADIGQAFVDMFVLLSSAHLWTMSRDFGKLPAFLASDTSDAERALAIATTATFVMNVVVSTMCSVALQKYRVYLASVTKEKVTPTFLFGSES